MNASLWKGDTEIDPGGLGDSAALQGVFDDDGTQTAVFQVSSASSTGLAFEVVTVAASGVGSSSSAFIELGGGAFDTLIDHGVHAVSTARGTSVEAWVLALGTERGTDMLGWSDTLTRAQNRWPDIGSATATDIRDGTAQAGITPAGTVWAVEISGDTLVFSTCNELPDCADRTTHELSGDVVLHDLVEADGQLFAVVDDGVDLTLLSGDDLDTASRLGPSDGFGGLPSSISLDTFGQAGADTLVSLTVDVLDDDDDCIACDAVQIFEVDAAGIVPPDDGLVSGTVLSIGVDEQDELDTGVYGAFGPVVIGGGSVSFPADASEVGLYQGDIAMVASITDDTTVVTRPVHPDACADLGVCGWLLASAGHDDGRWFVEKGPTGGVFVFCADDMANDRGDEVATDDSLLIGTVDLDDASALVWHDPDLGVVIVTVLSKDAVLGEVHLTDDTFGDPDVTTTIVPNAFGQVLILQGSVDAGLTYQGIPISTLEAAIDSSIPLGDVTWADPMVLDEEWTVETELLSMSLQGDVEVERPYLEGVTVVSAFTPTDDGVILVRWSTGSAHFPPDASWTAPLDGDLEPLLAADLLGFGDRQGLGRDGDQLSALFLTDEGLVKLALGAGPRDDTLLTAGDRNGDGLDDVWSAGDWGHGYLLSQGTAETPWTGGGASRLTGFGQGVTRLPEVPR
ncbi:MAG: hypothetical protein GY884_30320 [Proteobacteria bacterium]|nr:hypothetical protein [Pseudomonadota bacterium]